MGLEENEQWDKMSRVNVNMFGQLESHGLARA